MYKLNQRFSLPMPEKFTFHMEATFLVRSVSNSAQRNVSLPSHWDTGASSGHLPLSCNFQGRTHRPTAPYSELKIYLLLIFPKRHSCLIECCLMLLLRAQIHGTGSQETECFVQLERTTPLSQIRRTNSPAARNQLMQLTWP